MLGSAPRIGRAGICATLCSSGETKVFEEHQDFMAAWFQYPKQLLSHGEVLDKKVKKTKSGGFM